MKKNNFTQLQVVISTIMLSGLVACGANDDKKSSAHNHIDNVAQREVKQGRLLLAEKDSNKLHVYSLSQKKIIQEITLADDTQVDRLHTSPKGGYALLLDRSNNKVTFYNSGLRTQKHGDHEDPISESAKKSSLTLNYVKPVHYQLNGEQATLFFDGKGDTDNTIDSPVAKSNFVLITDDMIKNGILPHQELNTNMHGTAEPHGEYIIGVSRNEQHTSSLPETIDLYEKGARGLTINKTFKAKCPQLHGSASSKDYSVFACNDGVVSIKKEQSKFTDTKIANLDAITSLTCKGKDGKDRAGRVGAMIANQHNNFVGFACNKPFVVNVRNNSLKSIEWTKDSTKKVVSYQFDASGKHLLLLDNTGDLNVLAVDDNYKLEKSIAVFSHPVEKKGHHGPQIVVNPNNESVYLLDGEKLVSVNLKSFNVALSKLDVTPQQFTWFGVINTQKDDHDHGHAGHGH